MSTVIKKSVALKSSFKDDGQFRIKGGLLKDTQFAWLTKGSQLLVTKTSNGNKLLDWSFDNSFHTDSTLITYVADLQSNYNGELLFAVGVQFDVNQSMVCIFGPKAGGRTEMIRAILMPNTVVSLGDVSSDVLDDDTSPLNSALCCMRGVLAVGLAGGEVLLVDMGLRDAMMDSDEAGPSRVLLFTVRDDLEEKAAEAALTGQHLALLLNSGSYCGDQYLLQTPEGEVLCRKRRESIKVTALLYVPQITSIVVGFNFGIFQIWNLFEFSLLYTSPVMVSPLAIVSFCFQEPTDDPRHHCYLWTIHDKTGKNHRRPFTAMYSLIYQKKYQLSGHGDHYQGFTSCEPKFEQELGSENNETDQEVVFVGCQKVERASPRLGDQENVNDVSLLLFAWRTVTESANIRLTLFDLDGWYEAQMPRLTLQTGTFMASCSIQPPLARLGEVALAASIAPGGVVYFDATVKQAEHCQPSAATYQSVSLFSEHVCFSHHRSIQEQALSALTPFSIANPTQRYQECVDVGLQPILTDVNDISYTLSVDKQREYLLSVALENNLTRVLSQCASTWMNGCQSVLGASLEAWLTWAWRRALACKACVDKIGVPLFDHSGENLDTHTQKMLLQCGNQLQTLAQQYRTVVNRCQKNNVDQGESTMIERSQSLDATSLYVKMMRWFVGNGLLPESLEPRLDPNSIPYPYECLATNYRTRRTELKEMTTSAGNQSTLGDCSNILYIDGLLSNECSGDRVSKMWSREGGNGLYPPPTLQALLHMYLIPSIPADVKHSIVMYLFLDLMALCKQDRCNTAVDQLGQFPELFGLSARASKVTQALWLLDHRNFAEAVHILLNPMVSRGDIAPWQHSLVLHALISQGQECHARMYVAVKNPPMRDLHDFKMQLTLLVSNGLLKQALDLQRNYQSCKNSTDLLLEFFSSCWSNRQMEQAMKLPFTLDEEKALGTFLNRQGPDGQDMYVYFFLRRSRVLEAREAHRKSRSTVRERADPRAALRDTMVNAFAATRPAISLELEEFCAAKKADFNWKQAPRPTPISVEVRDGWVSSSVSYKSSLINASMIKARETWSTGESLTSASGLQSLPFLCTPTSAARRSFARLSTPMVFPTLAANTADKVATGKRKRECASSDAELLLQTPHVQSKTPVVLTATSRHTPHSILKVRQLSSRVAQSPSAVRRIAFTLDEESLAVDPPNRIVFDLGGSETESEDFEQVRKQARFGEDVEIEQQVEKAHDAEVAEKSETANVAEQVPFELPTKRKSIHEGVGLSARTNQVNAEFSSTREESTTKVTIEAHSETTQQFDTEQIHMTIISQSSTSETYEKTTISPVVSTMTSASPAKPNTPEIHENITVRRKRRHSSSDESEKDKRPALKYSTPVASSDSAPTEIVPDLEARQSLLSSSSPAVHPTSSLTKSSSSVRRKPCPLSKRPPTYDSPLPSLPLTDEIYIDDPSSEDIFNVSSDLNFSKENDDDLEEEEGDEYVAHNESVIIEDDFAEEQLEEENDSYEGDEQNSREQNIVIHSVRTLSKDIEEEEHAIGEEIEEEDLGEEIEEEEDSFEDEIGTDEEESSASSSDDLPKGRGHPAYTVQAQPQRRSMLVSAAPPSGSGAAHDDDSGSDVICLDSDEDEGPPPRTQLDVKSTHEASLGLRDKPEEEASDEYSAGSVDGSDYSSQIEEEEVEEELDDSEVDQREDSAPEHPSPIIDHAEVACPAEEDDKVSAPDSSVVDNSAISRVMNECVSVTVERDPNATLPSSDSIALSEPDLEPDCSHVDPLTIDADVEVGAIKSDETRNEEIEQEAPILKTEQETEALNTSQEVAASVSMEDEETIDSKKTDHIDDYTPTDSPDKIADLQREVEPESEAEPEIEAVAEAYPGKEAYLVNEIVPETEADFGREAETKIEIDGDKKTDVGRETVTEVDKKADLSTAAEPEIETGPNDTFDLDLESDVELNKNADSKSEADSDEIIELDVDSEATSKSEEDPGSEENVDSAAESGADVDHDSEPTSDSVEEIDSSAESASDVDQESEPASDSEEGNESNPENETDPKIAGKLSVEELKPVSSNSSVASDNGDDSDMLNQAFAIGTSKEESLNVTTSALVATIVDTEADTSENLIPGKVITSDVADYSDMLNQAFAIGTSSEESPNVTASALVATIADTEGDTSENLIPGKVITSDVADDSDMLNQAFAIGTSSEEIPNVTAPAPVATIVKADEDITGNVIPDEVITSDVADNLDMLNQACAIGTSSEEISNVTASAPVATIVKADEDITGNIIPNEVITSDVADNSDMLNQPFNVKASVPVATIVKTEGDTSENVIPDKVITSDVADDSDMLNQAFAIGTSSKESPNVTASAAVATIVKTEGDTSENIIADQVLAIPTPDLVESRAEPNDQRKEPELAVQMKEGRRTTRASSRQSLQSDKVRDRPLTPGSQPSPQQSPVLIERRRVTRARSRCSESSSLYSEASLPVLGRSRSTFEESERRDVTKPKRTTRASSVLKDKTECVLPNYVDRRRAVSEHGKSDMDNLQFRRTTRASARFGANAELSSSQEIVYPPVKTAKTPARTPKRTKAMSEGGLHSPTMSIPPHNLRSQASPTRDQQNTDLEEFTSARRLTRFQRSVIAGQSFKSHDEIPRPERLYQIESDSSLSSSPVTNVWLGSSEANSPRRPRRKIPSKFDTTSSDREFEDSESVGSTQSESGRIKRKAFEVACQALHTSPKDKSSTLGYNSVQSHPVTPKLRSLRAKSLDPELDVRRSPRLSSHRVRLNSGSEAGPSHAGLSSLLQPIKEESASTSLEKDEESVQSGAPKDSKKGNEVEETPADKKRRRPLHVDTDHRKSLGVNRYSASRKRTVFIKPRRNSDNL